MLSDVVGEQITAWRRRRGWNRERLAAECAALGSPDLTAASLTNIESGRRNKDGIRRRAVTVDEVTTIAYALGIPPIVLIAPYPSVDTTEALPGTTARSSNFLTWFTGEVEGTELRERYKGDSEKIKEEWETWRIAKQPLELLRSHNQCVDERLFTGLKLGALKGREKPRTMGGKELPPMDPDVLQSRRESLLKKLDGLDAQIVSYRQLIMSNGYPLPDLPAPLAYLDDLAHQNDSRNLLQGRPDDVATRRPPEGWMNLRFHPEKVQ